MLWLLLRLRGVGRIGGIDRPGGLLLLLLLLLLREHRRLLLSGHLDVGVVGRGRVFALVVEAECMAVEDESGDEQKPGAHVSRDSISIFTGPTYITKALRPAIALMTASPTDPATAARLSRPRFDTTQVLLLTALPSLTQYSTLTL